MNKYEIFIKSAKDSSNYILFTTIICAEDEIESLMANVPEFYSPPLGVTIVDDFSIRYFGSSYKDLSKEQQIFISNQCSAILT